MSLANIETRTNYVFFGGALSDNGNFLAALDGVFNTDRLIDTTGPDGTMSDGVTWAEALTSTDLRSSTFYGLYYGVSGAGSIRGETLLHYLVDNGRGFNITAEWDDPRLQFDLNLTAQVDRFAADVGDADLSRVTAFVLAGEGDYDQIMDDISRLSDQELWAQGSVTAVLSVAYTLQQAQRLADMGTAEVVVASLPEYVFYPSFGGLNGTGTGGLPALISFHNDLLSAGVAALQDQGMAVTFLDFSLLTRALADDPGQFNLPDDIFYYPAGDGDSWTTGGILDLGNRTFTDGVYPTQAANVTLADLIGYARGGRDMVSGTGAGDVLNASGADTAFVLSMGGDDTVQGSAGGDRIFLGSGDDLATGSGGRDFVIGGAGNDTLLGGAGDDALWDGEGNDIVQGGDGDDALIAGAGSDLMIGGAGDDEFYFLLGYDTLLDHWNAPDTVVGGAGFDRIIIYSDNIAPGPTGDNVDHALRLLNIQIDGIESIVFAPRYSSYGGGWWILEASDLRLVSHDFLMGY